MALCPVCEKRFAKRGVQNHVRTQHPDRYREFYPEREESDTLPIPDKIPDAVPPKTIATPTERQIESHPVTVAEINELTRHPVKAPSPNGEPEAKADPKNGDIVEIHGKKYKVVERTLKSPEVPTKSIKNNEIPIQKPQKKEKPKKHRFRLKGLWGKKKDSQPSKVTPPPIGSTSAPQPQSPQPPQKMKDPEGALELILAMPWYILIMAIILSFVFDWNFWVDLYNQPIIQLYIWIFGNIGNTAAMMFLLLTVMVILVVSLIVHKGFYRMLFKDIYIKSMRSRLMVNETEKETKVESRMVFMPSTREGRVYLTIGIGFWDRVYRKRTKKPRPDILTLYIRRSMFSPLLNPFRLLHSCDKVYVMDPDHTRVWRDGRWRMTVAASRFVRDAEDNSLCYWLEDETYSHNIFNSDWYKKTHEKLMTTGTDKVKIASLINPDLQQEQMRHGMTMSDGMDFEMESRIKELEKKQGETKQNAP